MAVSLPNGVILSLSKTMETSKPVTDIANGQDPALTAATATLSEGDIVLLKSGWQKINEMPFKIGATNKLLGADTTSTEDFPTASAAGSVEKVTVWQQITQVLTADTSGGEQQFATYGFLENDYESQIPTETTPINLSITVADDPSLPGYQEAKLASDRRTPRILKISFPNGSEIFYYAYVSVNETPTMTKGQVMGVTMTFSLITRPQRYAKK